MSKCLVVKRKDLEELPFWNSLNITKGVINAADLISEEQKIRLFHMIDITGIFLERSGTNGVELLPEWQQIIFYCIIKRKNEFFVYIRGGNDSDNTEKRLNNKLSIGIGGHVDEYDKTFLKTLDRELYEEATFYKNNKTFKIPDKYKQFLGVIKDDRDEVGSVHFGLIYLIDIPENVEVKITGSENITGWFTALDEYMNNLKNKNGNLISEGWTQLVIDNIIRKLKFS